MYEFHIPLALVLLVYMIGGGICYVVYGLTMMSGQLPPKRLSYHQECITTVLAVFWPFTLPFYGVIWLWCCVKIGWDFLVYLRDSLSEVVFDIHKWLNR